MPDLNLAGKIREVSLPLRLSLDANRALMLMPDRDYLSKKLL